ncbi:hypothetical protein [Candidatus Poriferisodalis sp.]|uniref:hypothetical protein n=1 Tax=Candidatus Poriferisodalis sp. TaxID=3101277 RepID=UPI003B5B9578
MTITVNKRCYTKASAEPSTAAVVTATASFAASAQTLRGITTPPPNDNANA